LRSHPVWARKTDAPRPDTARLPLSEAEKAEAARRQLSGRNARLEFFFPVEHRRCPEAVVYSVLLMNRATSGRRNFSLSNSFGLSGETVSVKDHQRLDYVPNRSKYADRFFKATTFSSSRTGLIAD
tara:strand:- start:27356 stop:27733 length:378 start_codon:yes stop_codon:yes gene_type:complete